MEKIDLIYIPLAVGTLLGITVLIAWIVEQLWNWLMVYLFDLPKINIWMAIGLMLFIWILIPTVIKYKSD